MKRFLLAASVAVLLAGCGTPVQRIADTKSGNPEVQIEGQSIDSVKARLLERLLNAGFQIDSETSSTLVASKEMTGMQESLMRMAISNSYATPVRMVSSFTFVKQESGTKVFARSAATSVMAMGQVRRAEMNSPEVFNATQTSLNSLKATFDKKE